MYRARKEECGNLLSAEMEGQLWHRRDCLLIISKEHVGSALKKEKINKGDEIFETADRMDNKPPWGK
jgi:hypothetical protein